MNYKYTVGGIQIFNNIFIRKLIHQKTIVSRINSIEWFLPSIENGLYLFPSWLKHYVKPNMNKKEERISISFNLNFE